MLHTRFRGNRPAGSGKKILKDFTIYGRGGHFGHVTQMPRPNFRSLYPRRLHIKFGFDWQAVSEKKMFEIVHDVRRRWTDGRRSMGIL